MNKRQRKKRDKKLIRAIKELNDDVALSEGYEPISHNDVMRVFNRIKNNPDSVKQTFRHYTKLEATK